MRRASILALMMAVACGRGGGPRVEQRAQPGDLAIVGATVVPMDREGALAGHTVLVRGDRIVAVAPDARVDTRGATVIDAHGKWVLPGLADMHVHLWGEDTLPMFTLAGVTVVRNLTGSPDVLRWRDAIAHGTLDGPTIVTSGPIIDGDPPTWPGSAVVTTAEAARKEVAAQKAAGYDWVKAYSGLSLEAYDALVDEARRQGVPVAGHVPRAVPLAHAIASGQRSIEHLDGYVPFSGDPPADSLVAETVKQGVWNCPTLVVTDRFGHMDDPAQLAGTRGLALVPAVMRAAWDPKADFRLARFTPEMFETMRKKNELRRNLVRALADAGAHLVLGTDTGNPYVVPGFAVGDELQLLVASGLTPWQALRMGTAAAAELLGTPGAFGVVAAGARADLLIVDRDPLADVSAVFDPPTVIVRGKPHDHAALLAAATPPPPPADPFATLPALAGVTARYEVVWMGQVIGVERFARSPGTVDGQAAYSSPQAMEMTYRSTPDALDLTTTTIAPPHVVIERKGGSVAAGELTLAAAPDAIIGPQAIGEFVWIADALADLAVGKARTLATVEVMTDGRLALHPGKFTFTRGPDADGRRVYAIAGTHGELALTGSLSVDADGAPHEVVATVKYGSFTTRRIE